MYKGFKKVITLTLSVIMLASILLGANVHAADKVKIEFWYGLGSNAGAKMEELIARFNESQDEVEVTGVAFGNYSEVEQKIQASMAAGNVPGGFMAGERTVKDYGEDGLIAEITQFANKSDIWDESDFLEVFMNQAKGWDDETLYAIPSWGTTQIMYYNKEVYEKAGVDPEWAFESWENLREASKKIVESGAAKYGHLPMWGSGNLVDMALSNGGEYMNEDRTEYLVNQPEWVEAWDFIREMVFEDKTAVINSGGQGWEYWYKTIDMVMNGEAASYTGSSGDMGDLDFEKIGAFEQPGMNGHEARPSAGANFLVIPSNQDKEKQIAAFKWYTYFTSPEIAAEWCMLTGYIPARKSTMEVPEYKDYIKENPHAEVPYKQSLHAHPGFLEPSQGEFSDALGVAADQVELQNTPAQKALDEAAKKATEALK